jgi:hypothetical protein
MTDQQTIEPPPQEITRVEGPMDRKRVGDITVDKFAGLTFKEYREVIGFCQLVCQARNGLPAFLKGNAADCVIIATQAIRWRLDPVWVMQHSYVTKADGIVNYENFVFGAIIMASGVIKGRPRYRWEGESENRTCIVSATFIGEDEPHEYQTPPLSQCRPPKNQDGVVKGSPLWTRDVDQQLSYYAIRNWGRRYIPELLGGVYAKDEFDDSTKDAPEPKDVSPNLLSRLPGKMEGAGFQVNVVDQGLAKRVEEVKAEIKERAEENAAGPSIVKVHSAEPEKPVAKPREPKTAEEYTAYAMDWIGRATNPDDAEARWDGEREMRAALKVPVTRRKPLDGLLVAKVATLRKSK